MSLNTAVRTELEERHISPSQEALAALVAGLGGAGNRFLVLARIPDLPGEFIQVWHEDGGHYSVEYRNGGPETQCETSVNDAAATAALLVRWARRDEAWAAGVEWRNLGFEPAAPVPPLDLNEEDTRLLRDRIRLSLVGGYDNRDRLTRLAEDYLADGDRHPVSAAQAGQLVDELWLERVAEQAAWAGETDPDRLTRAFRALDAAGITAREDFACCHSCGQGEIGGAGSPDARGFVYFHHQITDAAAQGHGLTLYYGGFDGSEATTAAIGHEVAGALGDAGLAVEWDGDPSRGINVSPLDWRKRLVG